MDAISQLWETVKARKGRKSSAWILDADIKKCFDSIDHKALLKKIPAFNNIIWHWLRAGAIDFGRFYVFKAGTPQGSIISPLLANIALDGMDWVFGAYTATGNYVSPSSRNGKNKGTNTNRYADDFVVTPRHEKC